MAGNIVIFWGGPDKETREPTAKIRAPATFAYVSDSLGSPGRILDAEGFQISDKLDVEAGEYEFYPNGKFNAVSQKRRF
jgi:hypothetical protein